MRNIFILAFIFAFCDTLLSQELSFDEIRRVQSGLKKAPVKKKKKRKNKEAESLKSKVKKLQNKLDAYRFIAKNQHSRPQFGENVIIEETQSIGATIPKATRATSTVSKIVLTDLKGVELPEGSKISCNVISKYKRVCGVCDRIIVEGKGYDIKATLNNRDGSNCVIGKLSDGKEKYLTGIFVSEMAQGALSISQSSRATIAGNIIENTASNKIREGLINSGDEVTDLMKEQFKTEEAIVSLPPFTDVVVQFDKGFSL